MQLTHIFVTGLSIRRGYGCVHTIVAERLIQGVVVSICLLPLTSYALDDNAYSKSERLRQQIQQAVSNEQQTIIDSTTPEITKATIPQNKSITPEAAMFMAINQHNWVLLGEMIDTYRQLPDAKADMLLFADAALQAGRGNIKTAISQYQQLLTHKPEFVRAQLDLARLYYQDGLVSESKAMFKQILTLPDLPIAVVNNIQAYLTAIAKKQSFNAILALGVGYEHNINESSESATCLFSLPNGTCGYLRTTPNAIDSTGFNIETTVNRDWQVYAHHGLTLNLVSYGTAYNQNTANEFNNSTINLATGYHYTTYSSELNIMPLIEYHREDNKKLYTARGGRLSYSYNLNQSQLGDWLSKPVRLSLDAEYKDFNYRADYANNDGEQWMLYTNFYVTTNPSTQWFLSLDYLDRDNTDEPNAYQQAGVRLGHYHQWQNGMISTASVHYRKRQHNAYNAILKALRSDKQINIYTNIRMPKWQWYGFEPSLSYQYQHNNSNVDWLYDYDSNAVWLKIRKIF